jgi:uncharacterized short protein YbdD (DUF466 family)
LELLRFNFLIKWIGNLWATIRQLSGDDAYERYLQHYAEHHARHQVDQLAAGQSEQVIDPLLTKEAFFKEWQDKKWSGVTRCC